MQKKIKILKVKFDNTTLNEASDKAIEWAKGNRKRHIVTPNPEILLESLNNHKFRKVLNSSDLSIPDGIGILWASKYLKTKKLFRSLFAIPFFPKYIRTELPERVTGTDLMQEICKKAADEPLKIFLLGAKEGVAEIVKDKLEKHYSGLKITGTYAGTPSIEEEKEIREKIDKSKADILFMAYGAPKQEMWIARNLKKLKTVKVAAGVGGAFNFIAGRKKRAPKLFQKLGLEWLVRLIQQPSRIKRIYNAVVKFPKKVISSS
ncbi:MAG: WecB/TagA/CpsF family glycosyltransferase [Candidatus Peregrinibacteria bacterium]